ncbi:MAG: hypothetical protein JO148_08150 [Acidimicrobiia bacterium]|nr:hypothetical protein [Acidimicrobiia bacterium]
MYWILFYDLVDDYLERREPLRPEHLKQAQLARNRGELVMAGALADPYDQAVFVWKVDDPEVIDRFVAHDPYVREGLVKGFRVRKWDVVVGG